MKTTFLFFILTIVFLSCIKKVDIKYDTLPQKIVVNGAICPDSAFQVRVSLSAALNETKQVVNNAIIRVFEDDIYLFDLPHTANGWYKVWFTPSEGKRYKVEVSVPTFETVIAETTIPVFPQILESYYEKVGDSPNEMGEFEAKTTIVFQDDPLLKNFYVPGQNRYIYEQSKEMDESILSESDLDYNPTHYYFSDQLFDGAIKNLQMMGGGTIYSLMGQLSYQQDSKHHFSIVSYEYFQGLKTWTIHKYNQSSDGYVNDPLTLLFLGEPIEMYTNVVGGLGVFAGYNSKLIPVSAHE